MTTGQHRGLQSRVSRGDFRFYAVEYVMEALPSVSPLMPSEDPVCLTGTMPFYIRDLSILGFWYPQGKGPGNRPPRIQRAVRKLYCFCVSSFFGGPGRVGPVVVVSDLHM